MGKTETYQDEAVRLHALYKGKIQVVPKCPVQSRRDFSIWYTPGVAASCRAIEKNPDAVYEQTNRANSIAIISDGSRVLGLGNMATSGPACYGRQGAVVQIPWRRRRDSRGLSESAQPAFPRNVSRRAVRARTISNGMCIAAAHELAQYADERGIHPENILQEKREVVIYFRRDSNPEGQRAVVTEIRGILRGRRVVRGRERECDAYYRLPVQLSLGVA